MGTYWYKTFKLSSNKTYEKKIEILNEVIKYQVLTKQMKKKKEVKEMEIRQNPLFRWQFSNVSEDVFWVGDTLELSNGCAAMVVEGTCVCWAVWSTVMNKPLDLCLWHLQSYGGGWWEAGQGDR